MMPMQQNEPDPKDVARIQANVAKMRAANAPEEDVLAYLQQEDSQLSAAPAPTQDTSMSMKNLARSFTQGATFGFGDEVGLTNRDAEKAFKKEHPIADFGAKLVGGAIAPAAAVAAAPELLGGLLGTTLLGGAVGAANGAGEAEGGMADRAKGAGIGLGAGLAGGAAGYGAAKAAGMIGGGIMSRLMPKTTATKAVGKAAVGALTPADASAAEARMAAVNKLAPGGSSPFSAAVAPDTRASRFLSMARGLGASPKAAASAEGQLAAQNTALENGMRGIGAKMDALNKQVPITPKLRAALYSARKVLGGNPGELPPAGPLQVAAPAGFQTTALAGITPTQTTIDTETLRTVLSDLRVKVRALDKQGIDANGVTKHAVNEAHSALKDIVYSNVKGFEPLDKQYRLLADEMRQVGRGLKTVELSRQNAAGNNAYGVTAGSLGGSLPKGTHGVAMHVLDKMLTNKTAVADATQRMVMRPGASIRGLLNAAPKPTGRGALAVRGGLLANLLPATGLPSSMRGLLSDEHSTP